MNLSHGPNVPSVLLRGDATVIDLQCCFIALMDKHHEYTSDSKVRPISTIASTVFLPEFPRGCAHLNTQRDQSFPRIGEYD